MVSLVLAILGLPTEPLSFTDESRFQLHPDPHIFADGSKAADHVELTLFQDLGLHVLRVSPSLDGLFMQQIKGELSGIV
jgi:hypothetical protein